MPTQKQVFEGYSIVIDVPAVYDKLQGIAIKEYARVLETDVAPEIISAISREYDRQKAKATLKSFKSIRASKPQIFGTKAVLEVAATGDRVRAMQAIELGRGKNKAQPPLAPIIEWMTARGMTQSLKPHQIKSLAFAIARTIAQRGIEPKYIFQNTINDSALQSAIRNSLEAATRRILAAINNG